MNHDQSDKLLFSHPEMVADLLRGFVHEDWGQHLDFDSLEKVSGTYVADDLREGEDDVIWKVRWGQEWLYVPRQYLYGPATSAIPCVRQPLDESFMVLWYKSMVVHESGTLPAGSLDTGIELLRKPRRGPDLRGTEG